MIVLLQRVTDASVTVNGNVLGAIGKGLMVLVCAEKGDTQEKAEKLAQKLLRYRVFEDAAGKLNLSVADIKGELLLVSQFTLAADTNSGNRPSFSPAADTNSGNRPSFSPAAAPEDGLRLFNHFVKECEKSALKVATGQFGAYMKVALTNDGPCTFTLRN